MAICRELERAWGLGIFSHLGRGHNHKQLHHRQRGRKLQGGKTLAPDRLKLSFSKWQSWNLRQWLLWNLSGKDVHVPVNPQVIPKANSPSTWTCWGWVLYLSIKKQTQNFEVHPCLGEEPPWRHSWTRTRNKRINQPVNQSINQSITPQLGCELAPCDPMFWLSWLAAPLIVRWTMTSSSSTFGGATAQPWSWGSV